MEKDTTSRKHGDRRWLLPVLSVVVVLALVAAGMAVYFWRQAVHEVAVERKAADAASAKVTSLEALQDKQATNEAQTPPSPENENVPSGDGASAVQTVVAYARAQQGGENATVNATLVKELDNFARVSVMSEGAGGYTCVLKRSEGIWLIVFCGQSAPLPDVLALWSVPDTMLNGLR